MSLATGIDDLLAHVPAADGQFPWCEEWQERFTCLDERVWVEACLLGLEGKLPREYQGHVRFWGQTKMPVLGKYKYATGKTFVLMGLPAWRNSLRALRALAEAKELARHAESGAQRLPANGAKVKPEDVPAELRELGRADGPILTATYLATTGGWAISSVDLTKAFQTRELTYRVKVGNAYAYLYTELFRLRERRADRKNEA
jgi:hypothetical protein